MVLKPVAGRNLFCNKEQLFQQYVELDTRQQAAAQEGASRAASKACSALHSTWVPYG